MFYEELLQYTEDAGEIFASYYKALAYTNVANESARYYTIANEGVIDTIKSFFSRIWEFIKSAIGKFWEFIKSVFNKIASIFRSNAEKLNKENEAKAKFIEAEKKLSESLAQGKVNLSGAQQAVNETKKAAEEMAKTSNKTRENIKERHKKFHEQMDAMLNNIEKNINEAKKDNTMARENLDKIREKLDKDIKKLNSIYFVSLLENPGEDIKESFGLMFQKAWKCDSDNISSELSNVLWNIHKDDPEKSDQYLHTFKSWFRGVALHQTIERICDPILKLYADVNRNIKIKNFDNFNDYKNFCEKYNKSVVDSIYAIYKVLNSNLDTLKPFESIKNVEKEVNKILEGNKFRRQRIEGIHESVKANIPIAAINKVYSTFVRIYVECTNLVMKHYKSFSFLCTSNVQWWYHTKEAAEEFSFNYCINEINKRKKEYEENMNEIRRKFEYEFDSSNK